MVLHRGKLVYEWYADGIDRDTKLASWSVAKSMVSLLADQAIAEGRLRLGTKVVDVIPSCGSSPPWTATRRTTGSRCATSST